MSRIKLILLFTVFAVTTSCNVHTFTFGEGPTENYSKVLKQHNFIGGLISNSTPVINEINNEANYNIVVKQSFFDGIFTIFSFGLYTPTTIIINK
tara:strand:+ start:1688 stop:1972 length:285 start_codon:yes stop_codon:yes gene_type:complete